MAEETAFSITVSDQLAEERAVEVACAALMAAVEERGWQVFGDHEWPAERQISIELADDADVKPYRVAELPSVDEQCYRITSEEKDGRIETRVLGAGVLGAAFGAAHLADYVKSCTAWPPQDCNERPRFAQRMGYGFLSFPTLSTPPYIDAEAARKTVERAVAVVDELIRARGTMIQMLGTINLFTWGDELLDAQANAAREVFNEIIQECHARRIRIYAMDDEFLYEPAWFERSGASLSVDDPKFWEAMKSKYRNLLEALPELDGIGTRVGEINPKGRILSWDLIHTDDDRSLEGNYRRFLKAMHEVVVGEYDKLYLHRTWAVNTWEQSSVPEIYRRVFTADLPTEKFISSIKITTGDQWEWQPINPTFGQSPHVTAAQVETTRAQDYFSGSPDFAAEFAQAGLEYALEHGSQAAGVNISGSRWSKTLWSGLEYVAWNLAWNPYIPVHKLTSDWAAGMFGSEISGQVADMLLDMDDIYRDGLHIRGPAYHTWEPLSHLRTGFICKGNPFLDQGRGQYRFLRDLYLQAKPELDTGLATMESATRSFDRWRDEFRRWIRGIDDPARGEWLTDVLDYGKDVLHLNLAYVRGFLRFFDFADAARVGGSSRYRTIAETAVAELEAELQRYRESREQSDYVVRFNAAENVQGIEVFLRLARQGLSDLSALIAAMRNSPDDEGVIRMLNDAKRRDEQRLKDAPDAQLLVQWNGRVDGRDVVRFKLNDGAIESDHYLGDGLRTDECEIAGVPDLPGSPAVRMNRGGERGWVYVLQAPTDRNDQTIELLIEDGRPGYASYDFEVFWIAT